MFTRKISVSLPPPHLISSLKGHAARLLMLFWLTQLLSSTDSTHYYLPYLLIGIIASVCEFLHARGAVRVELSGRNRALVSLFALLFSTMIFLSNYRLWNLPKPYLVLSVFFFAGGWLVFRRIFSVLASHMDGLLWKASPQALSPMRIFLVCFAAIVLINGFLLFTCLYPGTLTPDSMWQISQSITGVYSNHHPYYHTLLIGLFLDMGQRLFGSISAGVAMYSVFQILLMAACFAFCLSTMARMRVPRVIIVCAGAFYALMPYHILYSIAMWKDVLFGGFVLLFILSFYRLRREIGVSALNAALLVLSSMGICLFRSNGFVAFLLMTFLLLLLFGRRLMRTAALFALVIVTAFILKHPVLDALHVSPPDTIESLSIPAQQIAKVIARGKELSPEQHELLSQVIDVEAVADTYLDYISDPVKELVRKRGNQQYLVEHKLDFLKLYVSLGLKYPGTYLSAWIDQTRGYWDGGFEYWRWANYVYENSLEIERIESIPLIGKLLGFYQDMFYHIQLLKIFLCIGVFVWLHIVSLFASLVRRDRMGIFAAFPVLALVCTLLIATPVYSEFRYIYAAFCTLPIVLVIALRPTQGALAP